MDLPAPADEEIAAATFAQHLNSFFTNSPRVGPGWAKIELDPLHVVVVVPALREDGRVDPMFVLLDGTWYDGYPPRVHFANPISGWPASEPGSDHYPAIVGSPGVAGGSGQAPIQFALHHNYGLQTGEVRQLLCFSHSFDYYFSSHSPSVEQRWTPGVHTVSATLSRIAQVLEPPAYLGPSSAHRS